MKSISALTPSRGVPGRIVCTFCLLTFVVFSFGCNNQEAVTRLANLDESIKAEDKVDKPSWEVDDKSSSEQWTPPESPQQTTETDMHSARDMTSQFGDGPMEKSGDAMENEMMSLTSDPRHTSAFGETPTDRSLTITSDATSEDPDKQAANTPGMSAQLDATSLVGESKRFPDGYTADPNAPKGKDGENTGGPNGLTPGGDGFGEGGGIGQEFGQGSTSPMAGGPGSPGGPQALDGGDGQGRRRMSAIARRNQRLREERERKKAKSGKGLARRTDSAESNSPKRGNGQVQRERANSNIDSSQPIKESRGKKPNIEITLTRQQALGIATTQGSAMSFHVEYTFKRGGPQQGLTFYWAITNSNGTLGRPVKLKGSGKLDIVVPQFRPDSGPFKTAIWVQDSNNNRFQVSKQVKFPNRK